MVAPLYEILEPNEQFFEGKNVIITGTVFDERILKLAAKTQRTDIIVDNYDTAARMAAMIGQKLTSKPQQCLNYKHLYIHYSSLEDALVSLENANLLVILIDKSKTQNIKSLRILAPKLSLGSIILAVGANDEGGKSANNLLKEFGSPSKIDTRRKCTLWGCEKVNEGTSYKGLDNISFESNGLKLELCQDEAVFSQGRVDDGTAMLIESLRAKAHGAKTALDLGCGCGVIGVYLKLMGVEKVTSTDVSASALSLTQKNASLNNVEITTQCADMLNGLGSFDVIVVNPPFHQGTAVEREATLNMIRRAPEHLNEGGALLLVGNSFLGYEEKLKESFDSVRCLNKSTRFCSYMAKKLA